MARRLVASFADGDPGVEAHVRRMDSAGRAALIGELGSYDNPPPLLRMLLSLQPTRLAAARETLRLLQTGALHGRAALFCVSELRIAITNKWQLQRGAGALLPALTLAWEAAAAGWHPSGMDGTSGHSGGADDTSGESDGGRSAAAERLAELGLLIHDVLRPLIPQSPADANGSPGEAILRGGSAAPEGLPAGAGGPDVAEGLASALQLLPPLLHAADTAELLLQKQNPTQTLEPSRGRNVSGRGAPRPNEGPPGLSGGARPAAGASGAAAPEVATAEPPPSEAVLLRLLACAWPARLLAPLASIFGEVAALSGQPLPAGVEVGLRRRIDAVLCGRGGVGEGGGEGGREGGNGSSGVGGGVGRGAGGGVGGGVGTGANMDVGGSVGGVGASVQPQLLGLAKLVLTMAEARGVEEEAAKAGSSAGTAGGGPHGGIPPGGASGGRSLPSVFPPAPSWCVLLLRLATAVDAPLLPEYLWIVESYLRQSPRLRAALMTQLEAAAARAHAAALVGAREAAVGDDSGVGESDGQALQSARRAAGAETDGWGTAGGGASQQGSSRCEQPTDGCEQPSSGCGDMHACLRHASVFLLLLHPTATPPRLICATWDLFWAMAAALPAALPPTAPATVRARLPAPSRNPTGVQVRGSWDQLRRLLSQLASMPALETRAHLLLALALHPASQGGAAGGGAGGGAGVGGVGAISGNAGAISGGAGAISCGTLPACSHPIPSLAPAVPFTAAPAARTPDRLSASPPFFLSALPPFFLLVQLFGSRPAAREAILSAAFDALRTDAPSPAAASSQSLPWCGLLHAISTTHLLSLHAHASKLSEWLACLSSLPPAHAPRVLRALLPLAPLHAGFGRDLFLLLRKMLGSNEPHCRALAVGGWCDLLSQGLLATNLPTTPSAPPPAGRGSAVLTPGAGAPSDIETGCDAEADAVLALRWAAGLSVASRVLVLRRMPGLVQRGRQLASAQARWLLLATLIQSLVTAGEGIAGGGNRPGGAADARSGAGGATASGAASGLNLASGSGYRPEFGNGSDPEFGSPWAIRFLQSAEALAGGASAHVAPLLVKCMHAALSEDRAVGTPDGVDIGHGRGGKGRPAAAVGGAAVGGGAECGERRRLAEAMRSLREAPWPVMPAGAPRRPSLREGRSEGGKGRGGAGAGKAGAGSAGGGTGLNTAGGPAGARVREGDGGPNFSLVALSPAPSAPSALAPATPPPSAPPRDSHARADAMVLLLVAIHQPGLYGAELRGRGGAGSAAAAGGGVSSAGAVRGESPSCNGGTSDASVRMPRMRRSAGEAPVGESRSDAALRVDAALPLLDRTELALAHYARGEGNGTHEHTGARQNTAGREHAAGRQQPGGRERFSLQAACTRALAGVSPTPASAGDNCGGLGDAPPALGVLPSLTLLAAGSALLDATVLLGRNCEGYREDADDEEMECEAVSASAPAGVAPPAVSRLAAAVLLCSHALSSLGAHISAAAAEREQARITQWMRPVDVSRDASRHVSRDVSQALGCPAGAGSSTTGASSGGAGSSSGGNTSSGANVLGTSDTPCADASCSALPPASDFRPALLLLARLHASALAWAQRLDDTGGGGRRASQPGRAAQREWMPTAVDVDGALERLRLSALELMAAVAGFVAAEDDISGFVTGEIGTSGVGAPEMPISRFVAPEIDISRASEGETCVALSHAGAAGLSASTPAEGGRCEIRPPPSSSPASQSPCPPPVPSLNGHARSIPVPTVFELVLKSFELDFERGLSVALLSAHLRLLTTLLQISSSGIPSTEVPTTENPTTEIPTTEIRPAEPPGHEEARSRPPPAAPPRGETAAASSATRLVRRILTEYTITQPTALRPLVRFLLTHATSDVTGNASALALEAATAALGGHAAGSRPVADPTLNVLFSGAMPHPAGATDAIYAPADPIPALAATPPAARGLKLNGSAPARAGALLETLDLIRRITPAASLLLGPPEVFLAEFKFFFSLLSRVACAALAADTAGEGATAGRVGGAGGREQGGGQASGGSAGWPDGGAEDGEGDGGGGGEGGAAPLLSPTVVSRLLVTINAALALAARLCQRWRREVGAEVYVEARAPGAQSTGGGGGVGARGGGGSEGGSESGSEGGDGGGDGGGGKGVAAPIGSALSGAQGSGLVLWLETWRALTPLLAPYGAWLRARRHTWPASCRKRVPPALFALERLHLLLIDRLRMCAQHEAEQAPLPATPGIEPAALESSRHTVVERAHPARGARGGAEAARTAAVSLDGGGAGERAAAATATARGAAAVSAPKPVARLLLELERGWEAGCVGTGLASVAGGAGASAASTPGVAGGGEELGLGEKAQGEEEEDDDPPPLPVPASSRRRLRSRNAFIDNELGSGGYGGDSYADLEDFIVVKKGRRY